MQLKSVLDGRHHCVLHCVFGTPIGEFGSIIVGIQGRIDEPQIDNGKGCPMHASGCKNQGIVGLGNSGIGQASRITIRDGLKLCEHVRDGPGKHILKDLKGDGILILRQNVNRRNISVVFGSAIDGNQLNVFRAFFFSFKDLIDTCRLTRIEVQHTCPSTRTRVCIATGRHSCSGGAHRGIECWTVTWSCCRRRRWDVTWRSRLCGWGNRYFSCSPECDGR
jgi:hypothetical protein